MLRGLQQQVDKRGGVFMPLGGLLTASGKGTETEQLLELVHYHQQVLARRQARLLKRIDQPQLAHAQQGFHQFGGREIAAVVGRRVGRARVGCNDCTGRQQPGAGQRFGQRAQRAVAWPQHGHAPGAAGLVHQAAVQRRHQAAVDQRRLARARRAHHRQEPHGGQPVDHGIDLRLAAEEQRFFALPERAQARERVGRQWQRAQGAHTPAPTDAKKGCKTSTVG